ncbi:hypothetical protein [Kitasatospora sp. NPDC097643]|uniref:TolB family protein n=1 Tax=Kitasatospora sp. NPDC097643 TaxID=3157230 RepID=UPI0033287148
MTHRTPTTRIRTTRNRWLAGGGAVLAAALLATAAATPAQATPPLRDTTQVDLGPDGATPDSPGWAAGVSANGRYALFVSGAGNLVPEKPTGGRDVYVRDLRDGGTERVTVSDDGKPLDGFSSDAAISADGRYVAFSSDAKNAVPGQTPKGYGNVYVRDRVTGRTELITAGDGTGDQSQSSAASPSISADGRYVAFVSTRTDLVGGASAAPALSYPSGTYNVFVTDRRQHTTRLVSVGADGSPADSYSVNPTISADGRTVGFSSFAGNLLPAAQAPGVKAALAAPAAADPKLSRPRFAPYYTYDLETGRTAVAATDPAGTATPVGFDATISPDGRYAVYDAPASRGPSSLNKDLFVRDLRKGTVTRVNTTLPGTSATGSSTHGVLTADNRWVYFTSDSENLVEGPKHTATDVYRHDLRTGRTERVSTAADGSPANGASVDPFVDAKGTTVVFGSTSGNLVQGVNDPASDNFHVFARTH